MFNLRHCTKLMSRAVKYTRFYSSDLYEPTYLDALKPKVPIYDAINIQLSGYDYPILESFQKVIHSMAKNMEINVEDCWALPHTDMKICTYKLSSDIIQSQYNLKIYKRVLHITDLASTQLGTLIRAIEATTPAGVSIKIEEHAEHHDEERYIPDKELIDLKQELEDIGGARKK